MVCVGVVRDVTGEREDEEEEEERRKENGSRECCVEMCAEDGEKDRPQYDTSSIYMPWKISSWFRYDTSSIYVSWKISFCSMDFFLLWFALCDVAKKVNSNATKDRTVPSSHGTVELLQSWEH
jgi:hypothetical protein